MNNWMKSYALLLAMGAVTLNLQAQEIKTDKKSTKEETIVIKKKNDSKEKYTIVVDGDKITINGKPVEEFKGDGVEVLRNDDNMAWVGPDAFELKSFNAPHGGVKMFSRDNVMFRGGNKAMLGVVSEKTDGGVKIKEVTKESAAAKAGLKEGDIITKVGESKIEDADDLYEAVGKYKPEDKVTITYKRDGKESNATATLEKSKQRNMAFSFNSDDFKARVAPEVRGFNWSRKPRLGVQIQDTEEGKGVKVLDVDDDTPAEKAGLKEDDIITDVNGKAVNSVDELRDAVKDLKDGDLLKLNYKRNNQAQSAEVKIPKKLKTSDL